MSLPLLLPLLGAVVYAASVLLIKRASDLGVGVWRSAFVANVLGALLFQPLLLLGGTLQPERWWQPLVVGLAYVLGQTFVFLSLEGGDVSVATPVLGLKIIVVAVLVSVLGGQRLPVPLWIAAVLATAGIALLNWGGGGGSHRNVGRTILYSALAAVSFAIFDLLVQSWSPAWGMGRFLPLSMLVSGVFSFAFIPRFRAPLAALPRATWRWLLAGSAVLSLQSALFVVSVAHWGNAAAANVVYASRGLWSIVLVWLFGHWVKSQERHLDRRILFWRLTGALLMMVAIVIALVIH